MPAIVTFDLTAGEPRGASTRVEALEAEGAARLWVGPDGGALRFAWPAEVGPSLPATAVLAVDVYHTLALTLPVRFAFHEGGEEQAAIGATAGVLPGVRTRVFFPLDALKAETIFVPRTPGRLKMVVFGRPTGPDRLAFFTLGVGAVGEEGFCDLSGLRLLDSQELRPPEGEPVADELGQWTARAWPGKTSGVADLRARLREADAEPETPLRGRTAFGGCTEVRFDPTGFFRTEHDGRRWWLVDPEGGAFFSAGVDCVRPEAEANVEGNEALCGSLPPRDGEFAGAWSGEHAFHWSIANLMRVFGPDWRAAWERLARKWLINWGFNTVANWADLGFARRSGLPYVVALAGFPETERTVFRDFPDVFAPEYATAASRFATQLDEFRDDPRLIGYFLRNEPKWGFGQYRIAEALLSHDPRRAPGCRRTLAEYLAEAHEGSETRFTEAWGGLVPSFRAVEEYLLADPALLTERAREDLGTFSRRMVDAYVRIPSDACRAVDPHHLNLGMRWAWIASDDLLAGSDVLDVFSLNMYQMAPDRAVIEHVARACGKPVLIGEFHWGARDRGLPSTGLRAVASQADRGRAYRYYVEQAAAMPDLVGTHYFQMNDQPVLGRFDGGNSQIGLVDVCWRPYEEMVAAARETHERLYDVASGRCEPFADAPEELPRIGF